MCNKRLLTYLLTYLQYSIRRSRKSYAACKLHGSIFYGTEPLSSNRQHLSYDGCPEVRRKIIRTVLCCIVY